MIIYDYLWLFMIIFMIIYGYWIKTHFFRYFFWWFMMIVSGFGFTRVAHTAFFVGRWWNMMKWLDPQLSVFHGEFCTFLNWLVVWLPSMTYFPINIGNFIIPIDFHIFQRGGPTTNQSIFGGVSIKSWSISRAAPSHHHTTSSQIWGLGIRWLTIEGRSRLI